MAREEAFRLLNATVEMQASNNDVDCAPRKSFRAKGCAESTLETLNAMDRET